MDLLDEYLKANNGEITSRRVSFKYNFDGTVSNTREIYKIEPATDSMIRGVMSLYTKDKKSIDFIVRRSIENGGDFGVLFDEDSVRFYIDSPFEMHSDSIYSIQIKDGSSIKRIYRMETLISLEFFERLRPIFEYLDLSFVMTRNDGQNYLRFKTQTLIPYEIMNLITDNLEMKEWIKEHASKYVPVWIQLSELCLTIYYKID